MKKMISPLFGVFLWWLWYDVLFSCYHYDSTELSVNTCNSRICCYIECSHHIKKSFSPLSACVFCCCLSIWAYLLCLIMEIDKKHWRMTCDPFLFSFRAFPSFVFMIFLVVISRINHSQLTKLMCLICFLKESQGAYIRWKKLLQQFVVCLMEDDTWPLVAAFRAFQALNVFCISRIIGVI